MRIAIFSDNFYPEISGVADSIMDTGETLAKRGHKIRFYVPRYSDDDFKFIGLKNKEKIFNKNVKIVRLSSFPLKSLGQGRLVIPFGRVLMDIKKFNPDIIHAHTMGGLGIEALIASKLYKIPLVLTNHSPKEELVKNIKSSIGKSAFIRYNLWFYNRGDIITSPSLKILDYTCLNKDKARVVPNPIGIQGISLSNKKKTEVKNNLGLSNFNLVFCGRVVKSKGIGEVIKAVSLLKHKIQNIKFIVIGQGTDRDYFEKMSEQFEVKDNVKFLGYKNKREIAKIYSLCQLFIIMGVENQPLAAMQAMYLGLPFIGSNAGGVPNLVDDGKNGFLIELGDYKSLAKTILYCYTHPQVTKNISINAEKSVEKFSSKNVANILENIYKSLL